MKDKIIDFFKLLSEQQIKTDRKFLVAECNYKENKIFKRRLLIEKTANKSYDAIWNIIKTNMEKYKLWE